MLSSAARGVRKTSEALIRLVCFFFPINPQCLSVSVAKPLSLHQPKKLLRIISKSRKHRFQIAVAQMLVDNLPDHAAIIRSHSKIAPLIKLSIAESRPLCVNFPALDVSAHHEHAICVPMVRPAI